jgi:hypothetical protein
MLPPETMASLRVTVTGLVRAGGRQASGPAPPLGGIGGSDVCVGALVGVANGAAVAADTGAGLSAVKVDNSGLASSCGAFDCRDSPTADAGARIPMVSGI